MEPSPKELAREASPATQWLMTICCVAGVVLGALMGWRWGGSQFADAGMRLGTRNNGGPSLEGTLLAAYAALAVAGMSALLAIPVLLGLWRDWRTTLVRRVLIAAGSAGIAIAGAIGAVGFDPDRAAVIERYGRTLGEPPDERRGELLEWLGGLSGLGWAFTALGLAIAVLLAVEVQRVRSREAGIRERWRAFAVVRAATGPSHTDVD